MDEFLQINWNPPLEDMLEGEFVNADRLMQEGKMYQALRSSFRDPFLNIHEDFDHLVTKELISKLKPKKTASMRSEQNLQLQSSATEPQQDPTQSQESDKEQQEIRKREYVPGILKNPLTFPKQSELTVQQHALCLKVLLRFSSSEKPSLTAADKEELQTYMNLMPIIKKEQETFLELVKSNWDASTFEIQEEEFINEQWKRKVKLVDSLPRYYTEKENIPFISPIETVVNILSNCLEMGTVPKIFLPKFTKRVLMPPNTTKINQRFFSIDSSKGPQENVIFKTPVSQDPNCEKLAGIHDVNMVISSGGLNCLALNIEPNITTSWILPVVIKRINDKNVVFVDKPLPPTGLNVLQKNAWIHKYNVKSYLAHPFHCGAPRLDSKHEKVETKEDDESLNEGMDIEHLEDEQENKNPPETEEKAENYILPPSGHNLFYRLFSINASDESKNELMKNRVDKTYKLLVRTKMDGILKAHTGEEYLTMIAAKVEHQLALGAEEVSVEEALKQWMSLTFRPGTSLLRVRMEAKSMEFIQFEKRTAASVNNEIKSLYGLKTDSALTLLYNVVDIMSAMNPGHYIIRHTPRNGAFACVYQTVDEPGKNVFDLQTLYWGDEFPTIPNPPWPPIDKSVVTPALKVFNRMPAMFYPSRYKQKKKPRGGKCDRGARGGRGGRGGMGGRGGKKSGKGRKKGATKIPDREQEKKSSNPEG
ncbi:uncharacterized protein [Venturia canescens]|uniref:uncharacterized protein isoform X2 n=1 Tax=Venturia canescens TaxID=32260 RepID=UPI001C9BF6EC|nr:uncharacterized protein LOC122406457 isoform X2 [Venturia canescens]